MGMFDNITYPSKFPGIEFQTKDTPSQGLDNYEIREDGTLWYEEYDAKWVVDSNALFGGYIDQYNKRWVHQEQFTGEIVFYDYKHIQNELYEYSAYFVKGKMENFQPIHEGKKL